jgi:enoyl-CoA hydratase
MELAARAAARDRALVLRTKATLCAGDSMTSAAEAVAVERKAQEWAVNRPEFQKHLAGLQQHLSRKSSS